MCQFVMLLSGLFAAVLPLKSKRVFDMGPLRSLLSLIIFVICAPVVAATSNGLGSSTNGYEVISADFGVFNQPSSGKPAFVATTVVPLIPDQGYGWIVHLRTEKSKIRWREEFVLPVKPDTWGEQEPIGTRSVSTDGRISITERVVSPDRGLIFNAWSVAPGDPKGKYLIRVFVEGALVKAFEFEVK